MAKYYIKGEKGGISAKISLPEKFNAEADKCDFAVVMHGFLASKRMFPITRIVKSLNKAGIGAISFDFDAHGRSEGRFEEMTMESEISDARAVFEYVCTLPYVRNIAFVGHSMGGVIAGMLAGRLTQEQNHRTPVCLVQLAAAAVLKDDAINGNCMGTKYDPANPPEFVRVFFRKLGRDFIKQAQTFPIYETSEKYTGKVCLIHGTADKIVPMSYSEKYHSIYKDSELHILKNVGHFMKSKNNEAISIMTEFVCRSIK